MKPNGVAIVASVAWAVTVVGVLATGAAHAAAQCGRAAWYDLEGLTASGEVSDGDVLAAAHRTLPFGTRVKVENLDNGREVIVRINDRGPFVDGRVIDLTRAAASKLGYIRAGVARVRVTVADDSAASLPGSCGAEAGTIVAAPDPTDVPDPTLRPTPMSDALARRFEDAFEPAEPIEPTMALRFQDAFKPGTTLIMDLPALGYAPVTDR